MTMEVGKLKQTNNNGYHDNGSTKITGRLRGQETNETPIWRLGSLKV
jgi:hypothetical protein